MSRAEDEVQAAIVTELESLPDDTARIRVIGELAKAYFPHAQDGHPRRPESGPVVTEPTELDGSSV
jgi:hypothetical protein